MQDDIRERADELADAHWGYIKEVLQAHDVDEGEIQRIGFHWQSAFVHGYKHAQEDLFSKIQETVDSVSSSLQSVNLSQGFEQDGDQ